MKIKRVGYLVGKVVPSISGCSGKLWLWESGVMNIGKKRPFSYKMSIFEVEQVFLQVLGPQKKFKECQTMWCMKDWGPPRGKHTLLYWQNSVGWKIGENRPFLLYFSWVSCLFLLGSCGSKSDCESRRPSG